MLLNENVKKAIFLLAALACFTPFIDPPLGLLLGLLLSQTIGHPFIQHNKKATKILLQVCVVGLGFGMNLFEAMKAGKEGFLFTVASISITMLAGLFFGRIFKIGEKITYLIAAGTAICGGSAIAAVSPLIDAKEEEISVSLGTVFILNSIALLLFPIIGHALFMSNGQFGLWSAIAIHDTSSVVGAAQKYGEEALKIATTVKLERALWIIPLSFVTALVFRKNTGKVNIPWFIFLFVAAMALNTLLPAMQPMSHYIVLVAKKGLTLTLFLIGAGLTRKTLQAVGFKPFLLGILLWVIISVGSLAVIMSQLI